MIKWSLPLMGQYIRIILIYKWAFSSPALGRLDRSLHIEKPEAIPAAAQIWVGYNETPKRSPFGIAFFD